MVLYKVSVFPSSPIFNMDMPEPVICSDWLKFQRSSSLKVMNWLNPNCKGMIIGKSFTKFLFFISIGNTKWPPLQDILLTQEYMGKYRNTLLSETTELIEPKLFMDVLWVVLYKITFFVPVWYSTWPPGPIMCYDCLKFQSCSSLKLMNWLIRVITKLPHSEQSYKGKVKTHKYINRQNQSTTGKLKTVMTLTWYRHF